MAIGPDKFTNLIHLKRKLEKQGLDTSDKTPANPFFSKEGRIAKAKAAVKSTKRETISQHNPKKK